MAELVNDDSFRSLEGKSKHQLWLELCDIITKHPKDVIGLKVDAVLRSGIRKFTDEVCIFNHPSLLELSRLARCSCFCSASCLFASPKLICSVALLCWAVML